MVHAPNLEYPTEAEDSILLYQSHFEFFSALSALSPLLALYWVSADYARTKGNRLPSSTTDLSIAHISAYNVPIPKRGAVREPWQIQSSTRLDSTRHVTVAQALMLVLVFNSERRIQSNRTCLLSCVEAAELSSILLSNGRSRCMISFSSSLQYTRRTRSVDPRH